MAWPVPFRRALTASVTRVTKEQILKKPPVGKASRWQAEAWDSYHNVPEVHFAARYFGNALSRTRFFVGTRDSADDPLTPITEEDPLFADLNATLFRLKGRDGSFASLARYYGIQQFIAGESFLVGLNGEDGEVWEMLSPEEINREAKKRKGSDGKDGEPLPDNAFIARMWTRDPQFSQEADSPMRSSLDVVEALRVAQALMTAGDRSQLTLSGLLVIPAEADLPRAKDEAGKDTDRMELVDQIIDAAARVMEDPLAAEAYVPIAVTMKADLIDKIRHIKFERPIDAAAAAKIEHLVGRFARGIDLPPEILMGTGAANHWGAWNISMEVNNVFVGPAAFQCCEDIYYSYFTPAMDELGIPKDQQALYGIGFDMTDLVVNPNKSRDAISVFDRFGLSFEGLRAACGFSDDYAPTIEEIKQRVEDIGQALPGTPGTREGGKSPGKPGMLPDGDPGKGQETPTQGQTVDPATLQRFMNVGKIVMAAQRAVDDAVASAVQVAVDADVPGLDDDPLAAMRKIGKPNMVARYGLPEEKLLAGAFRTFRPQVQKWMLTEEDAGMFMAGMSSLAGGVLWRGDNIEPQLTELALAAVFETASHLVP